MDSVKQPFSFLVNETPRRLLALWGMLAMFVAVADACLYKVAAPAGGGRAMAMLCFALMSAGMARGHGRIGLGAAILAPSIAATLLQPSGASTLAFLAGIAIMAWTNRANEAAWGLVHAPRRLLAAPFALLECVFHTVRLALGAARRVRLGGVVKIVRLVLPALAVSALFLIVLSFSNAVLWQLVGNALGQAFALLARVVFPPFMRAMFWALAFLLGSLFMMPALLAKTPAKEDGLFAARWERLAPAKATLGWVFILGGVNLVFLLTNTLDVIYLWIKQAPPDGVGTTGYLYGGVYGLIFATLLAGGLLAALFNGSRQSTRSPLLRGLGIAWIAQNVFLIAGAAFRLWLHVERYCLTPRRVEVAFFLLLVLAGFFLLAVYIAREKTLRWLAGRNVLAVAALVFCVQFADVGTWCVDSALRRHADDPALNLDARFIRSVGFSGWRVVCELAKSDSPNADNESARECWSLLQKDLGSVHPAGIPWQSRAIRASREARGLCEALGAEGREGRAAAAWKNAVRQTYAPVRSGARSYAR